MGKRPSKSPAGEQQPAGENLAALPSPAHEPKQSEGDE